MASFKFKSYISWGNGYRAVYNNEKEFEHLFTYQTHPGSIMQYTGITDLKNNEVYESDILKINDKLYLVFWDEFNARFSLQNIKQEKNLTILERCLNKVKFWVI